MEFNKKPKSKVFNKCQLEALIMAQPIPNCILAPSTPPIGLMQEENPQSNLGHRATEQTCGRAAEDRLGGITRVCQLQRVQVHSSPNKGTLTEQDYRTSQRREEMVVWHTSLAAPAFRDPTCEPACACPNLLLSLGQFLIHPFSLAPLLTASISQI